MKRSDAARLAGIGVAFWAASVGGMAWAQTTPAEPPAIPAPAATDAPQIEADNEAAKKEVQAYQAAYRKMEKESGPLSAMQLFLSKDYKNVEFSSRTENRDEYIKRWAKIFTFFAKQAETTGKAPTNPLTTLGNQTRLPGRRITEKYSAQGSTITVMERIDDRYMAPFSSGGVQSSTPHAWRTLKMSRYVFQRTPEGLRLQEEAIVSIKRYVEGRLDSELPVPSLSNKENTNKP